MGLGALGMNREQLKTVLELFRTNVLTEDQTIDIIMGNNSYKGRPRGDFDTNDPVKALIVKQLDLKGLNMKEVSLGIGRNETYLHQFIAKGTPKRLHENDRQKLAKLLGVSEDQLRG